MNDSNDDQPNSVPEEGPKSSDNMSETREAFRDLGDSVKRAFQAGTSDARKAAKDAVPHAGQEFAKGLHDIAYGVAYLASFGVALAREITPEPVNDGFREGSGAGRKAAENLMKKRGQEEEKSSADESPTDPPEAVPV